MAIKILQEEEKFHSKIYTLELPRFRAKILLKSASSKLHFVMTKAMSKFYTLSCSCKCYSYA